MKVQSYAERLKELDDIIARCLNVGVMLIQERERSEVVQIQVNFLHNLMRRREVILHEAMRTEGLTEAQLIEEVRAGGC